MADVAEEFAREASGVVSARTVSQGEFIHEYRGEITAVDDDVRLLTLAPAVTTDAVKEAFTRVAGQWHNPSTHPNIISVHDRGDTPRPWLAVEKPAGRPLDTIQQELSLSQARSIIEVLTEAIRNASLYNTIHSNLQPKHVYVTTDRDEVNAQIREEGYAQIDEWGLERACRVAAGQRPVTPFTAPELLDDPVGGTERTDVYGLGALAYYALTGQQPIERGADGLEAAVRTGDVTPPSAIDSRLPEAVDDVVLMALAGDPTARQDTIYAFQTAITGVLPEEPRVPSARPDTPAQSADGQNAETDQPTQRTDNDSGITDSQSSDPSADSDRNTALRRRGVLGVLGIGLAGVVSWYLTRSDGESSATRTVNTPTADTATETPAAATPTETPGTALATENESGRNTNSNINLNIDKAKLEYNQLVLAGRATNTDMNDSISIFINKTDGNSSSITKEVNFANFTLNIDRSEFDHLTPEPGDTLVLKAAGKRVNSATVEMGSPSGGEINLNNSLSRYVIGDTVHVSGTTPQGVSEVAIYAYDSETKQWQHVLINGNNTITVDDNEFFAADVVLSGGSRGNQILSFPGTYWIGAVDVGDVGTFDSSRDDRNDLTISTSNFSSAISGSQLIQLDDPTLTATFETYNGRISDDDAIIDVDGTAPGQDSVVITFVDRQGNTIAVEVPVNEDNTFKEAEIPLQDQNSGGTFARGTVTGHVISMGLDNKVGDGSDLNQDDGGAVADTTDLTNWINDNVSGSGDQVRTQIQTNTVDASGSDDLIKTVSFRLSRSNTQITDIYPEGSADADTIESGETMVIEGVTNRRPSDNVITNELLTQNDNSVGLTSTNVWDTDGEWSVTLETDDIEPGTYVVHADDGSSADRQEVEIVAERSTPTPTPETPTQTSNPKYPSPRHCQICPD